MDKLLHLSMSFMFAQLFYTFLRVAAGRTRHGALKEAAAYALVLGIVKEIADLAGLGTPEVLDLTFNLLGVILFILSTKVLRYRI